MTNEIRISETTEFSELSAFLQEHKGKAAYAVEKNGIEIYASDRAAAKPDAKGLGDAMSKSAMSPQGQELAKKALHTSISNTYGKDIADYVVTSMRQDLMAPDASLSDLVEKATATIDKMFTKGGLSDQSKLYRQQAAILDDAKLVAEANQAADKDKALNEQKNAAPDNSPAPASLDENGNAVIGPKKPDDTPVVADMDDEDLPLFDPVGPDTAGLELEEDGDKESDVVDEAAQQNPAQAGKPPENPSSVSADDASADEVKRPDSSAAAAASGKIRDLAADMARVEGALDRMQKTYDDIQVAFSRSQQKRAARRQAMVAARGRPRTATVDQPMNARYRDNIRKIMGQNFIDVAEKGGGNGVPSFTKLLEAAKLPTDNAVVREKAKEYVLAAFRSYDQNDFNTLTNAQRANDVALPALQQYHDLREI